MRWVRLLFTLAILVGIEGAAYANAKEGFVTWKGIGPDKWVSAWLIHRHIAHDAKIRFIDTGKTPVSGIAFDIPGIPPYIRNTKQITYENLLSGYQLNDPGLAEISTIIRDIEINFWGGEQSVAAPLVETAFRGLQLKYGRQNVPKNCYFQLFDALYKHINENPGKIILSKLEQALAIGSHCGSVTNMTVESDKKYVAEWHPRKILGFLGAGDKVVFIDTREADEYEEGHIPGAINIKLRDIGRKLPPELKDADIVIPYCVKDFRGFEVAKRLKKLGVRNVGLMNPWGISGWKANGLPVAGTRGLQQQEAMEKLNACVNQPAKCLKDV